MWRSAEAQQLLAIRLDAQAFQTLVAAAPCDGRLVVEVKLILPTVSWGMSASVTGRDASMLPWAHVGQSE